jgi:hypothetical protein
MAISHPLAILSRSVTGHASILLILYLELERDLKIANDEVV